MGGDINKEKPVNSAVVLDSSKTSVFPPFVRGHVLSVPAFQPTFESELINLINRYSKENESNTPDFILATYIQDNLEAFNKAVTSREWWYGHKALRAGEPQNVQG